MDLTRWHARVVVGRFLPQEIMDMILKALSPRSSSGFLWSSDEDLDEDSDEYYY